MDYFLERLEFREIPREIVEAMLNKVVERYSDVETSRFIAVQRVKYKGRYKRLLVAYEEEGDERTVVTIYTVTKRQIQARIKRQRWVPK